MNLKDRNKTKSPLKNKGVDKFYNQLKENLLSTLFFIIFAAIIISLIGYFIYALQAIFFNHNFVHMVIFAIVLIILKTLADVLDS